ncbi:uncharacterized protein G2W53_013727 [Senna tora]|uniref:DUF4283 domain-containing protein n=1 Tax=Senna tora TaxID=362788 RepID=A0A834WST8_9FABA|nr:uncharacterized protein G2W53_013727 [Senna tora]
MSTPKTVAKRAEDQEGDPSQSPAGEENTNRSKKKVRKEDGSFSGTESRAAREEPWMGGNPIDNTSMSYLDVVRSTSRRLDYGDELGEDEKEEDGQESEPDKSEGYDSSSNNSDEDQDPEEGDGITVEKDYFDRLNFKLSDREWRRLNKPFKKALIIKLLGKTIGFKFLLRKVNQLWGRTGEIELVDLGNEYFLAKFDTYSDREFALTGGPWIVLDHCLIVRPWTSLFDPEEKVQKLATWVHLPDLPIELYDDKFLFRLGHYIGKVIRIDVNTSLQSRGKYARLYVELDLSQPLLSQYCVHGIVRKIEYEGLHFICFECGTYGHDIEHCRIWKEKKEKEKKEKESANGDKEAIRVPLNDNNYGEEPRFGAWMTVQRERRVRKPRPEGQNQNKGNTSKDTRQGSRFSVLDNNEEESEETPGAEMIKDTTIIRPQDSRQAKTNWNVSKTNPVFTETREKALVLDVIREEPVAMDLGSPVKQLNNNIHEKASQIDDNHPENMVLGSPVKEAIEESYQKEDYSEGSSELQPPNPKENPPDTSRKKVANQKSQNAVKNASKRRDFNEIASITEQRGPKRLGQGKLYKRLDRVLCNQNWRTTFSDASSRCLTRINSDHHPLLVSMEEIGANNQNRPFRFENCWMQHEDFTAFLKQEWNQTSDLNTKILKLQNSLKTWNKDVFGDISKRKKRLLNRINGIQVAIDKKLNPFLEDLGRKLAKELEMFRSCDAGKFVGSQDDVLKTSILISIPFRLPLASPLFRVTRLHCEKEHFHPA